MDILCKVREPWDKVSSMSFFFMTPINGNAEVKGIVGCQFVRFFAIEGENGEEGRGYFVRWVWVYCEVLSYLVRNWAYVRSF